MTILQPGLFAVGKAARCAGAMAVVAVLAGACENNYLTKDFVNHSRNFKNLDFSLLQAGQSRGDVERAMQARHDVIDRFERQGRTITIWRYEDWASTLPTDTLEQQMFLFFADNRLFHWSESGNVEAAMTRLPPVTG